MQNTISYEEFRNTYKTLLKKYYEISNLYGNNYKITLTKTEFCKIGSRWKETKKETKEVDYIHYCNVFDAVYFFKNLGGYERTNTAYTIAGHIPTEQISISPSREKKSVYHFTFSH